eukprot:6198371-Pleurochrysis_carterae.AAC.4
MTESFPPLAYSSFEVRLRGGRYSAFLGNSRRGPGVRIGGCTWHIEADGRAGVRACGRAGMCLRVVPLCASCARIGV